MDGHDEDKSESVVSGGSSPEVFQTVERDLDPMPLLVVLGGSILFYFVPVLVEQPTQTRPHARLRSELGAR